MTTPPRRLALAAELGAQLAASHNIRLATGQQGETTFERLTKRRARQLETIYGRDISEAFAQSYDSRIDFSTPTKEPKQ